MSDFHRKLGNGLSMIDLDFPAIELNGVDVAAFIKYKERKYNAKLPELDETYQYQVLINMANKQGDGVPAFVVYCDLESDGDHAYVRVIPANDHAKKAVKTPTYMNARAYAQFLHKLRGHEQSVIDMLTAHLDNKDVYEIIEGIFDM